MRDVKLTTSTHHTTTRRSLRTRLKYAITRLRLGRDGRKLADDIARKEDHAFFFGAED